MAEMLAKIHRINLTIPLSHEAGAPSYHPDSLLQSLAKAEIFNCSFVADLLIHKPALLAMSDAYVRSIEPLKQTLVMTHGDMDQKNVLWDGDQQPILIDWEAATWVNPSYDLINLALNWSGIITEQFDQDLFIKMIQAYQKAGGVLDQQLLSIAFDGAYGWIHWLVYNIERSCVLGESEQKNIGIEQVNQTLAALLRLRKARLSLLAALGM
jgi:thiamine kinase-like enzyme